MSSTLREMHEKLKLQYNAKTAYDAYTFAVDNKSWNGEQLKDFHMLPLKIQEAWLCVYKACVNDYKSLDMLPLE